VAEGIAPKR